MNKNFSRDKRLNDWMEDTQGLLATPIFYKLGFKKRMLYFSKIPAIEKNYKKAMVHIKSLGFTKNELIRMVRIIENTYSPLTDIVLPIVSFFSGGFLTVLFGETILEFINREPVLLIRDSLFVQILSIIMLLLLGVSMDLKIRYESLKGKTLIILHEIIDEMATAEENNS